MTWTAKFNAGFTKPIIRQLLAFIQRDQRAALDFVGGANVLPSIVSYQISPTVITQFPAILVSPGISLFDRDAVGTLKYTTQIFCSVAITHQDQQVASELLQDYARAIDALMNALALGEPGLSDFHLPWPLTMPALGAITTTPLPITSNVNDLWVASHTPEIRNLRTRFDMASTLELHLDMEET